MSSIKESRQENFESTRTEKIRSILRMTRNRLSSDSEQLNERYYKDIDTVVIPMHISMLSDDYDKQREMLVNEGIFARMEAYRILGKCEEILDRHEGNGYINLSPSSRQPYTLEEKVCDLGMRLGREIVVKGFIDEYALPQYDEWDDISALESKRYGFKAKETSNSDVVFFEKQSDKVPGVSLQIIGYANEEKISDPAYFLNFHEAKE